MKPSFFSLFKRGMFCRPVINPSLSGSTVVPARRGIDEAERFAGAAVAFAWRHDPQFRQHFWNAVCRFKGDPPLSSKAEMFVEPHRWADLLIVNPARDRRYVYAVEFKIHAGLQHFQNPARREFAVADGYGAMLAASEGGRGTALRFVVCGWRGQLDLKERPWRLPIAVQQREWDHLAINFPRTSLARDLAISLGVLGIDAFPSAEVATMKIDAKQTELPKACTILCEVGRRLDWPESRTRRTFYFYQDWWYLGTELLRGKTRSAAELAKMVAPRWSYVGWFGYQGQESEPPELAVWFYCGKMNKRQELVHTLRRKLKGCGLRELPQEHGGFDLVVSTRKHRLANDCQWFCSVFRALDLEVKP
jgi:hypothetical protein